MTQTLPEGWRIDVLGKGDDIALCVFGPPGAFAHIPDGPIQKEVVASLRDALDSIGVGV
jgi:hypothetical protein